MTRFCKRVYSLSKVVKHEEKRDSGFEPATPRTGLTGVFGLKKQVVWGSRKVSVGEET
jgi:hypothetical protein